MVESVAGLNAPVGAGQGIELRVRVGISQVAERLPITYAISAYSGWHYVGPVPFSSTLRASPSARSDNRHDRKGRDPESDGRALGYVGDRLRRFFASAADCNPG